MPGVIILNPAAVFLDPNQQAVQSNATLTASGSQILTGYGATEVSLFINVTATPTGTTPTLQYTLQEVDSGNGSTVIGTVVSSTVISAIGIQRITLSSSFGGSIKVSWTVGGTTPSFTGVYATLVGKSGNVKLADSTGALISSSNPLRTDPTGTTTQPVSGTVTANIGTTNGLALDATLTGNNQRTRITDGTTLVAVKAASTAAVAADPALVVAVSPNNSVAITAASLPLPTGAATETTLAAANTKLAGGLPAALVGARLDTNLGAWLGSTAPTVGQKNMASSVPVVMASDQSPIKTKNQGNQVVLLNNVTVVGSGSQILDVDLNEAEVVIIYQIAGPVTGTSPTYTITATDLQPTSLAATTNVTTGPTLTGVTAPNYFSHVTRTGKVRVDWTVGGTTPSFGGVTKTAAPLIESSVALIGKAVPPTGKAIAGKDPSGFLTNIRVAADGTVRTDPSGTTTQPVSGTVTSNIGTTNGLALDATLTGGTARTKITDGTNNAAVKAASTAPVAADPALVVAISPNSSITATNPSVGTNAAAIPTSSTQIGGSDGTNLQAARVFDADSGGGTQYVLGAILRKSASGGSVEAGTSTDPLRIDPTGTTTQPVSDGGDSLTVDGTVTANQGTAAALAGRWPVQVTDGTNTMPTGDAVGRAIFEKITDGTNTAAVKAASTAAVATDPALVVAVSPNNSIAITAASLPLPTGAATETTLAAINTKTPALGQALKAASVPVAIASDQLPLDMQLSGYRYSSTIPDPTNYATTNQTPVAFDKQGRLEVHATTTGDKGAFRDEFTGASITTALSGTLSFTNNSATVTGVGTGFTGLAKGQWIKKTSDSETLYGQIYSVGNDTTLTLTAVYLGTTASGVTAVVSNWQTVTATGGAITVATSLASLTSGVTSGQSTYLRRDVSYGPYTFQHVISISQRIANQTIFAGPADNPTTPTRRARVEFSGTVNTQCTLVTSAGLLAGDIQSTTVTLPNGGTTATLHNYRIEQSGSRVSLVIDNIRVATHDTHLPEPYAQLGWYIGVTNTGVPASSTTVNIDIAYSSAYERTQVDNDFSGEPLSMQGADSAGMATIYNPVLIGGLDQNSILRSVATDPSGVVRVVTPVRQRVSITFQAVAPAVADTLLTLVKSTNGTAAAGATTQPVAANKILRLTSMTFSLRAGAAAAAFATFNLRINASGAAVIGSPSEFRVDLGNTEAVIGAARSITIPLVDGFELSGTQQLAVSAAAQAVTNILSVTLTGYEYAI